MEARQKATIVCAPDMFMTECKTMMMKTVMTAMCLLIWTITPAMGWEGEESLAELVLEAMENNAEIRADREVVQGLLDASEYAGALPNPKIGVGLLNVPTGSFDLDQEAMTQKQISVTQRLPWPGKRGLAAESRLLAARRAEAGLKAKALALQREVAGAYYELWFVTESLRLNGELYDLVSQLIHASASRYGAGREVQQAVLTGELELSGLTNERLALDGKRRGLEIRINRLLQREAHLPVIPETGLGLPRLRPSTSWVAQAERGNPRLEVLKHEVALSRVSLSLAEKESMPDVDVKLAYGQREDDPMGNSRDDFVSLSASFPVPVWKSRREDRLVASRRATERAALLNYEGYRLELPHLIDGVATQMATAVDRHEFYNRDLVPRARQLSQALVSRYEVGGSSYTDMIEAAMAAMRAELTARQYLRDALLAEVKLMELAGGTFPGVASLMHAGAEKSPSDSDPTRTKPNEGE